MTLLTLISGDWIAIASIVVTVIISAIVLSYKVGGVSKVISNLSDDVKSIDNKVTKNTFTLKAVTTFLCTNSSAPTGLFENNSPIKLTNVGIEVLDKSGGK